MNTSVLLPDTTEFSIIAFDLVVSPNKLRLLIFKKLGSKVASFKLLATYHTPAEAFNTESLV